MIRRLQPDEDKELFIQAFNWDACAPAWYRQSDAIYRPTLEEHLQHTRDLDQVDIGVFDKELIGLITFDHKGNWVFEIRLSAKRGASLDLLAQAGREVRHQIFTKGAQAGFVWIAAKNRHVRKLCNMIGFVADGLTMYRGRYNDHRPIEWVRMVTTRAQWANE